jgi:hypothetical protein
MDAPVGGEVQGTFSGSPGFGLALPRAQADQAGGKDLADFGQAFGGGHQIRVEGVRSSQLFCFRRWVASNNYPGSL